MQVVGILDVAPAEHELAAVGEQQLVVEEFAQVVPVPLRTAVVLARQRQVAADRREHRVDLLGEGEADEGELQAGAQAIDAAAIAGLEVELAEFLQAFALRRVGVAGAGGERLRIDALAAADGVGQ
ncbi:hypothetical protein SDC9_206166 [bioreactor metagenome]|uniref:Uncharacterized protein n=1 Tax=bioreactor metagenome TaxID=1076179 RepID=A0A645J4A0_9ZZZZ